MLAEFCRLEEAVDVFRLFVTTRQRSGTLRSEALRPEQSKAKRAQQQAEVELDKSVYEYDEVYDNMKAAQQSAVRHDASEIWYSSLGGLAPRTLTFLSVDSCFLASWTEDKMIAREREREGDEFADKDQFVTPAYLAQQEDLRKERSHARTLLGPFRLCRSILMMSPPDRACL
jgi:hypothetical protein